jgi:uncharacterized membrane protein YvbJ
MPFCQHCGTENPAEAKFCKECGKPPFSIEPTPTPAPTQAPTQNITQQVIVQAGPTPKKRHPIIGFIGLILILIGIGVSCADANWGIGIGLVGAAVLVFALITGNMKLSG